jgi:hypothetical protein
MDNGFTCSCCGDQKEIGDYEYLAYCSNCNTEIGNVCDGCKNETDDMECDYCASITDWPNFFKSFLVGCKIRSYPDLFDLDPSLKKMNGLSRDEEATIMQKFYGEWGLVGRMCDKISDTNNTKDSSLKKIKKYYKSKTTR